MWEVVDSGSSLVSAPVYKRPPSIGEMAGVPRNSRFCHGGADTSPHGLRSRPPGRAMPQDTSASKAMAMPTHRPSSINAIVGQWWAPHRHSAETLTIPRRRLRGVRATALYCTMPALNLVAAAVVMVLPEGRTARH